MERSKEFDVVQRPKHYNVHPSGLEAIDLCEHLTFNLGNAVKYIWRAGLKNDEVEDLKKALWYIKREQERIDLYEQEPYIEMVARNGRSQAMTEMIVRVLARKIIAAEPAGGLLSQVLMAKHTSVWASTVEQELKRRQGA